MSAYVDMPVGYFNRYDIRKLYRKLGDSGLISHLKLMICVAVECEKGYVPLDFDFEFAGEWKGTPGAFKDALMEITLVFEEDGKYQLFPYLWESQD